MKKMHIHVLVHSSQCHNHFVALYTVQTIGGGKYEQI